MNTDKNKKIHNIIQALSDLIGKLPEEMKNDPALDILREAAREKTVTVVHLIYRRKNYETSSKDFNFSRLNMIDHWQSGERDVHLSMRHPEWFERPRDQTMVTWDLTADDMA